MDSTLAAHPLKLVSMLACGLLVAGIAARRRKRVHISLMVAAMAIDVAIVVYLEVRRGVVESIPGREMTPLLFVHILVSVAVLILYGLQVFTGLKNVRGLRRPWHRRVGWSLLVIRLGNLVTSWMLV